MMPTSDDDHAAHPALPNVPPTVQPFLTIGTLAIVAGGVVAAVTGPTDWDDGSWVAAYLVLVVGVGQIGLGSGQAALRDTAPARRRRVCQALVFDAGSALVIVGTLTTTPVVVTAGGAFVVVALVSFAETTYRRATTHGWVGWAYLGVLATLIVSTPIGLVLAWARA